MGLPGFLEPDASKLRELMEWGAETFNEESDLGQIARDGLANAVSFGLREEMLLMAAREGWLVGIEEAADPTFDEDDDEGCCSDGCCPVR